MRPDIVVERIDFGSKEDSELGKVLEHRKSYGFEGIRCLIGSFAPYSRDTVMV